MSQAIITIAVGNQFYAKLASNLALSFYYHNPNTQIAFYIATDVAECLPSYTPSQVNVIKFKKGELGVGFTSKLKLDKIAPATQTLFIDADCLIYGSVAYLFDLFKDKNVGVVGGYISNGEWFGDVKNTLKINNIEKLPKFNGGLYYLEKTPTASSVFATAQKLEPKYQEMGLVLLRGKPNEELLMAIALEKHHCTPIPDDGTIMSDPQACPGPMQLNILYGKSKLQNHPGKYHSSWYPFTEVSPKIVHFLGFYTKQYIYISEVYRLILTKKGLPIFIVSTITYFGIILPCVIKHKIKDTLRNIRNAYRKLTK